MTRQFLWNLYGTEVLVFEKEKVAYYSDFKYFKDSHQSLEGDDIEVSVEEVQEWDKKLGRLVVTSPKGEIEFAILLPVEIAYIASGKCQELVRHRDLFKKVN